MVCRTRTGETLSLGFCLPSCDGGKHTPRRLGASATIEDIAKISRPPDLRDIGEKVGLAPREWETLQKPPQGCTVRLIGSRLWALLTGGCYVRSTSDLDVVVDLIDVAAADAGAGFLASANLRLSVSVDGELSFPGTGEVHWKEWLSESQHLLLKSVDRVALIPRAEFSAPSLSAPFV